MLQKLQQLKKRRREKYSSMDTEKKEEHLSNYSEKCSLKCYYRCCHRSNCTRENKVYTVTHLSVWYWNAIRKLTTTINTLISQTPDPVLENVKLQDNVNPQQDKILKVPNIESIESVQKFKFCRHCSKWIIQVTENIINCDHCHHKMRTSASATKLSVSLLSIMKTTSYTWQCVMTHFNNCSDPTVQMKLTQMIL